MENSAEGPTDRPAYLRIACAVALMIGAAAAGGSTTASAQAVVLCCSGLLLAFFGIRQKPPPALLWTGGLLMVFAFVGLAKIGYEPGFFWRQKALALGIPVSRSICPQPAVLLHFLPIFGAGVLLALWSIGQNWSVAERRILLRSYAIGVACIAAAAFGAYFAKFEIPGWTSERHFGPFPNRNHTANLFCVAAILAFGAAEDRWHARHRFHSVICSLAGAVLAIAVMFSYSRAGVVLLFLGAGGWIIGLACISRSRRRVTLIAGLFSAALAIFLACGGATAGRLLGVTDSGESFRMRVFQDTLAMIHSAPLTGYGLGNFEGVFPQFRKVSVLQQKILHPESDLLLTASETGWISVLALTAAIAFLVWKSFPMDRGTARRARITALAAGAVFLLHGTMDVPAHRFGSVLPALFIAGIVISPVYLTGTPPGVVWIWSQRIAGVALAGLGFWMLRPQPTVADSTAAQKSGDTAQAVKIATELIRKEPLAWTPYYARASGYLQQGSRFSALADFRRARFLNPTSEAVPVAEARQFAAVQPQLATEAWREAVNRASVRSRPEVFATILSQMPTTPEVAAKALEIAGNHVDLLLAIVEANREPAATEAISILEEKQKMTAPELASRTTRAIARFYATKGDYKKAVQSALSELERAVPPRPMTGTESELHLRLAREPDDFAAGYALYLLYRNDERTKDAFLLTQKMIKQPGCPAYFRRFAATYLSNLDRWKEAWEVLAY